MQNAQDRHQAHAASNMPKFGISRCLGAILMEKCDNAYMKTSEDKGRVQVSRSKEKNAWTH